MTNYISLIFHKTNSFIIFCMVGGVSAVVDITSLFILSDYFNFKSILSVSLAFFLGLVVNYYLHTYLTFKTAANKSNLVKFLIVVGVNYTITIVLIEFLTSYVELGLIISKVITLPIIAISGFFLSKLWVYND